MRKLLALVQRLFIAGGGRPAAIALLAWLVVVNIASERDDRLDNRLANTPTLMDRAIDVVALPFRTGRQALFDAYQKAAPRQVASNPVTIVAIDEQSLTEIGQWPWPRNRLADLIRRIGEHQPAAIGLDIYMPEEDQTSPSKVADNLPPGNQALAAQLRRLPSHEDELANALRATPSVLGAAGFDLQTLSTTSGLRSRPISIDGPDPLPLVRHYPWVLASLPQLQAASHGQALLSVDLRDSVVRRMPLIMAVNGQLVPGLAMEMLRVGTGSSVIELSVGAEAIKSVGVAGLNAATQPSGDVWLHFAHAHAGAARYVSASAVFAGKADPELLANKLVLIGLTGFGLADQRTTALGELVPGIEIQAQMIESLFDGRGLLRPYWMKWLETALLLVMGGFLIYAVPRGESRLAKFFQAIPRAPMWLTLALNALVFGAGYLLFVRTGLLLDASASLIILSSLLASLFSSAMIALSQENATLAAERQQLRESAAHVAGELSAARRIQMGSLPDASRSFGTEKRFDLAAFLEPARDVGGDLYDFFMIDERRLCLVIGDVSGKGVPASLFMAVTKTLAKALASHVNAGPGRVAELANAALIAENTEMLFVTLIIGILDVESGELALVNAGHDAPWRLNAAGELEHLESPADAGGPPLCMVDDFPYAAQFVRLSPGDTLVLVTDGITEAMNPDSQIYGTQRLERALLSAQAGSSAALIDAVRDDVARHVAGAEASDDMTLLVIRWTPLVDVPSPVGDAIPPRLTFSGR
jgi:adenylate cyclase